MKLGTLLCTGALMLGMATAAQAQFWCNIQWPTPGNTVAGNADLTVYSQVWKDSCTPNCADLVATLYFRPEGDPIFQFVTMDLNVPTGNNNDEYMGVIPVSGLIGNTVELYVEYFDVVTGLVHYAENDYFTPENPAMYYVEHAGTTVDFSYNICVDTHCIDVDPELGMGVIGTFNGWTAIQPLCEMEEDLWCGCITIPAGTTPPEIFFKFRNGGTAWEDGITDRYYLIPEGLACDNATFLWDDWDCPIASADETPMAYELSQNYPNPFNPSTTISFSLAETAEVKLAVYDLAGRQVATLAQGMTAAGSHEVMFNAEHLSSGIYVYTLNAGDVQISRRMVLVK